MGEKFITEKNERSIQFTLYTYLTQTGKKGPMSAMEAILFDLKHHIGKEPLAISDLNWRDFKSPSK